VPQENRYFADSFNSRPESDYSRIPRQEQVFEQAINLENEISALRNDVTKVNNDLTSTDAKKAADLINDQTKKVQVSSYLSSNYVQIENMEESLSIFYETLKWIENAAVDLKF
jgi:hypothetical protein